jgi:hypothetical protein
MPRSARNATSSSPCAANNVFIVDCPIGSNQAAFVIDARAKNLGDHPIARHQRLLQCASGFMTMTHLAAVRTNNLEEPVARGSSRVCARSLRLDGSSLRFSHSQALPGLGNLRLKRQNQPASRRVFFVQAAPDPRDRNSTIGDDDGNRNRPSPRLGRKQMPWRQWRGA